MLTDKLGMYAATGLALLAILWGVSQCGAKDGARFDLKQARLLQAETDMRLRTCSGNVTALRGSIDAQNKALDDLSKQSAAKLAESEQSAQGALKAGREAKARADRLSARGLSGVDQCQRLIEADDQIREALEK